MAKIHYFQRYSSPENTVTNNTLQLLSRIYKKSPERAAMLLNDLLDENIDIGLTIDQQIRKGESVPDGSIYQNSFRILIESKVDSGVNMDQLMRHAKGFNNERLKILILLTKSPIDNSVEIKKRIHSVGIDIKFKNITYEMICDSIKDLFMDYEFEINEIINDYIEYCNETGLIDQSRYLMKIVPCGDSHEINKIFSIYYHPASRGYTNHSFVGIYTQKRVCSLFKVEIVVDADYVNGKLVKNIIKDNNSLIDYDKRIIEIMTKANEHCGHRIFTGHRFFIGESSFNTNYVKVSPGGIQGARYVNLKEFADEILDPKTLSEKLSQLTWK